MAWLEIIRKKRSYPDSAKYGQELSFPGVRVVGGSMTSPVTFVSHWELSKNYQKNLNVCFQADSSKLKIEKNVTLFDNDGNPFILEATYDSLHDTIIVQKTSSCLAILLNLKFNPKLYENGGKHKNTTRAIARHTGFEGFGCLNTFYFEFNSDHSEIEFLLSRFACIGFHVVYADMQTTASSSENIVFPPDNFEVAYAWQCVQSLGYKVTDHLSTDIKRCIEHLRFEKTTLTPQIFNNLAVQLMEKPFFSFKGELLSVIKMTPGRDKTEHNLPSHYFMVARVVLTPTKLLYLPKEPVFKNRILRQYGEEFFIRVVFRDEDFEKISTVQSYALDNILERMKNTFKNGLEIHGRHYEFLGCSNSQLREHSFWFLHPHNDINADFIQRTSGKISSEKCVASYVSRFGLCFSASRKTVDVDTNCVEYRDDEQNDKYCFTDGIGCISPHLAKIVSFNQICNFVKWISDIR